MRKTTCAACTADVTLGATYRVADKSPLCEPCGNAALQRLGLKDVPPGTVEKNVDPTICSRCGTDWGTAELSRVGGAPLCSACIAHVRNFPFPRWVKVSFAALLVVVAVDAVINARYLIALHDLKEGTRLMQSQKIDEAAERLHAAAHRVPSSHEMQLAAVTVRGLALLSHDRSAEAEKVLGTVDGGGDETYEIALMSARMGAAFDRRDYDGFLTHARQIAEKLPKSASALASVASAYACKFAVSGDERFRAASLDYLERARKGERDGDFADYEARIQHRLDSREIINAAEYHRRFGKGGK